MLSLLQHFNYTPPTIVPGKYGNVEIEKGYNCYFLREDGHQWMVYNIDSHEEVYDVFSHYYFAKGHVIVTGMGFGARENWILTKPEVTKLTIVEKNENILNYHKIVKSSFLEDPRVEIIIANASEYKTSCDTLLLDHYEQESYVDILTNVEKVQSNIQCNLLWFWPLERIIMHCRKWHSDNDAPYKIITKHQAYNLIKKNHNLNKLPDLDKDLINLFCMMYNSKLFSQSEKYLETVFSDRKTFHDIHINI
jgi:hypothetical protein